VDKRDQEALELVCKLNEELFERFGTDYPDTFQFSTNGWASAILLGDWCIWDSENDPQYDDDDNEIPLEKIVRDHLNDWATVMEWVARNYMRDKINLDHVLARLNEWTKLDTTAMESLIEKRTICNVALADAPSIQVMLRGSDNQDAATIPESERVWEVGVLGLLNGLFGSITEGEKKGWGQIAAVFDDSGRLQEFRRSQDKRITPEGSMTSAWDSLGPETEE
jgi:hypothetical protein